MKKIIMVLSALLLVMTSTANAKTGDVIGKIYSTDIKAYINEVEIPSYSLEGKTAFIIEDITDNYLYNDELRVLNCMMYDLNSDSYDVKTDKPGRVVGNVYETDITTYFRGIKIPCFALNGKMAVAIEDMGNDKEWSQYGAKYVWDAENRTISLDVVFDNQSEMMQIANDKEISVYFSNYVANIKSEPIFHSWGGVGGDEIGVHEIMYNDTPIGYEHTFPNCTFTRDESGKMKLKIGTDTAETRYINESVFKEIINSIEPHKLTVEEWIQAYTFNMACYVTQTFETDDYIFLDMWASNSHGGTHLLRRIDKHTLDQICYDKEFESVSYSGNKQFDNVVIDKENETVSFRYDRDYVIDLKTGKIK